MKPVLSPALPMMRISESFVLAFCAKRPVLALLICLFFIFSLFLSEASCEEERKELWSGTIYTSTFRCGFCFAKNGQARGVLLLKTLFGQVDVYHLYGTISANGRVDVRHSSGHHVVGQAYPDNSVKGSITLGSGKTLSFTGKRTQNVRLAPSDCAPLDD
ncbi:MAG: hypothetical protein J5803_01895 [Desulfovibrio sp.]|nr:hypothetical protein [Desulfovibrio sp.]